ncbi:MAG: serine hydrolase domain-containing protein [Rhizomicrobium sp.]
MTAYHHGKSGMARRAFLAAGGAAVLLSAAARAAPYAASRTPLDGFIDAQRVSAGIPGMAVGYARDGVVRFARGYGFADIALKRPVTADTMFHIASVTKTVTATMILRLAEQGRLKLDETVAPYLDFPLVHPHRPDAAITFRHLLMHASGISDARYYAIDFRTPGKAAALPLGSFLKDYLAPGGRYYAADGCFSRAVSGAAWDYSNVGFALLGYVAGRIGGDMREQSRRQIFAPLGMAHTDWSLGDVPQALRETPYDGVDGVLTPIAPDGFPDWPAGLMRSSVADFARFVAASANGGDRRGHARSRRRPPWRRCWR